MYRSLLADRKGHRRTSGGARLGSYGGTIAGERNPQQGATSEIDKGYDSVAVRNRIENVFDYIPLYELAAKRKSPNPTADNVLYDG